jgi:uncharacterized repeat protein (TIGR03943 family)
MHISVDKTNLFRGLLLMVLSLYFLKLSHSGDIHFLVSDTIARIVPFTAIPLFLVSCAVVLFSIKKHPFTSHHQSHQAQHGENGECGHDHKSPQSFLGKLTVSVLLLSLAIAYDWHPRAIGSEMIKKTPVPQTFATNSFTTNNRNLTNSVSMVAKQQNEESEASLAMKLQADPKTYIGKRVSLDGFVYHPPELPPNYFILTRYFVFCCIADAYPIGITVRSQDTIQLKNDTWVHVSGVIQTKPFPILDQIEPTNWYPSDVKKPVIVADSVQVIPTPDKPYMMP